MLDIGIHVFWFSKETYLPGNDLLPHSHKYYHYIYVLSGTADIRIDSQEYVAQEDEFYLTNIGSTHSLCSKASGGIQVIEIKFEVTNKLLAAHLEKLDSRIRISGFKIRHMLESLIGEGMNKEVFYDDFINLKVAEVLLVLLRSNQAVNGTDVVKLESARRLEDLEQGGEQFRSVLIFMEKNMGLKLNLETLAKVGRMSKHHFCRSFKSCYGVSPMQYLNRLRIAKAKELMLYSDLNITQLAYTVGFQDIHYFSRSFKQRENISPNEFLQNHKRNLYFYLPEGGNGGNAT